MKRYYLAASSLTFALGLTAVAASPATASAPTNYCNGKSQNSVVKNFYRGNSPRVMRCGTSSWGFNHIVKQRGWNSWLDSQTALTISRGASAKDVQQDGGTQIYEIFDNKCHPTFRVIYNGGALNGRGVNPQGVITAYPISTTTSTFAAPLAQSSSLRTNCPIYQNI